MISQHSGQFIGTKFYRGPETDDMKKFEPELKKKPGNKNGLLSKKSEP